MFGVCILVVSFVASPALISVLTLWTVQVAPMFVSFKFGGMFVRPSDLAALLILCSLAFDVQVRRVYDFVRRLGAVEAAVGSYILALIIAAAIGIAKGQYGSAFRSDFFRGPMHFIWVFVFRYVFTYWGNLERFGRHWLYAALAGAAAFAFKIVMHITTVEVVEFRTARIWGFNLFIFSMSTALTFLLGLSVKRSWWLLTLAQLALLVYSRFRTFIAGMAFAMIFSALFYALSLRGRARTVFLLRFAAVFGLAGIVAVIIIPAFFAEPTSPFVFALKQSLIVFAEPQNLRFVPSLQARFIETIEALHKLKQSSILWGTGLGTTFATMRGFFFIDSLYPLILCKAGVVGLAAFLSICVTSLVVGFKLMRRIERVDSGFVRCFAIVGLAAIPTALAMALTNSHLWISPTAIISMSFFIAFNSHLWSDLRVKRV